MIKEEFLAVNLPYKLKLKLRDEDDVVNMLGLELNEKMFHASESEYDWFNISAYNPIIRDISTLTKSCIQADYNNGQPFIPIVELAKIEGLHGIEMSVDEPCAFAFNLTVSFGYRNNNFFKGEINYGQNKWIHDLNINNYFKLYQQLLKWHFWPNMPEDEDVVYVDDNFNPYK